MTIQNAKKMKETFFLKYKVDFEEIVLKADGFLIIDLDLFFFRFHEAAVKKITLINSDTKSYYEWMVRFFLLTIADMLLFYSRLNNEQFSIRHVRFTVTFAETQSRYVELKEWTRKKRNKGGYEMVQLEDGSTCCELFLVESDPLQWIVLPTVDRAKLSLTRSYMSAVYDYLLSSLKCLLYDFTQQQECMKTEEQLYWKEHIIEEMQLSTIHLYGWRAFKCTFDFDSRNRNSTCTSLKECILHSGEADLYVHNEAAHFKEAQENFTIIYEFGDSDAFPILINAHRECTFPHGFYLNSGIIQKEKVPEPFVHNNNHIRFRKGYRNVYFWMDVVACRSNFLPLEVNVILGERNYGYFDRFKRKYCDSRVPVAEGNLAIQSRVLAAFSIATILSGTDFTPSFQKGYGNNVEKYMLRLLDGSLDWNAIENRVKPPPSKKRSINSNNAMQEQENVGDESEEEESEQDVILYHERVRENIAYWKIANATLIFPTLQKIEH